MDPRIAYQQQQQQQWQQQVNQAQQNYANQVNYLPASKFPRLLSHTASSG